MKNIGTILATVLVVVLVVFLLGSVGMMGGFGGRGMIGGYNGYGGMMSGYGFNPLGTIISLIVWALVIGGIVWLVVTFARNSQGTAATPGSGQTPLAILQARYARGEITKEQFDTIKQDIGA